MTATTATTQALIGWINETRQHAPMLDNEADALLARLNSLSAREEALDRALVSGAVSAYMATRRPRKRTCWLPCAAAGTNG